MLGATVDQRCSLVIVCHGVTTSLGDMERSAVADTVVFMLFAMRVDACVEPTE